MKTSRLQANIEDIAKDTAQIPIKIANLAEIYHFTSDILLVEMVISIKNLTSEQLTRMIILAADTRWNEYQFSAIVMTSQYSG
ncbi:MAG: hypothetical protein PUP91_30815 [Rhizonema sp. PD37]|nr:hypothetical protein [Rhizonema sp. PD37]